MSEKTKQIVVTTAMRIGKSIIEKEHSFFLLNSIDDTEHLPRIRQIVESVETGLVELGLGTPHAKKLSNDLREYAKSLFMESWMTDLEETEDKEEIWLEGSDEFDGLYLA